MSSLTLMQGYVAANALIIAAWMCVKAVRALDAKVARIRMATQLQLGYGTLAAALILPFVAYGTSGDFLPQAAQVWSSASMQEVSEQRVASEPVTLAFQSQPAAVDLASIESVFAALLLLGLCVGGARVAIGLRQLLLTLRSTQALRRLGSARVLCSDQNEVPFSFWLPARHYIVVPASLLSRPNDLMLAIRHEAQHHRQGDTKTLYAFEVLLGLCFWNPFAYALLRHLRELQEFACDESLLRRRSTDSHAYCACLVRVAQHASARRVAIAMGMCGSGGSVFFRRIEVMMNQPANFVSRWKLACLSLVGFGLMSMAAIGLATTVKDRRVTFEDAQRMALRANTTFPIAVNESVVQELNRYLGTPDGRAFVRGSLERMRSHGELIDAKLDEYGLPKELMAVPLVESGYRNLSPSRKAGQGAGLWMFIKPTAHRYSLRVDEQVDDRLNVAAETDAAMRMFSELYAHFGDWGLALLAYNVGAGKVERGIQETGSRDVWKLVGSGYQNDPNYVPRVMAAMLIVRNPQSLE
jgi:membrane-bound lytic murein transglycosylase D